jgi:hypothetical protein
MKPRFLVYEVVPQYGARDEFTGTRSYLRATAETEGWANAQVNRLADPEDTECGWTIRDTRPAPSPEYVAAAADMFEDLPF